MDTLYVALLVVDCIQYFHFCVVCRHTPIKVQNLNTQHWEFHRWAAKNFIYNMR